MSANAHLPPSLALLHTKFLQHTSLSTVYIFQDRLFFFFSDIHSVANQVFKLERLKVISYRATSCPLTLSAPHLCAVIQSLIPSHYMIIWVNAVLLLLKLNSFCFVCNCAGKGGLWLMLMTLIQQQDFVYPYYQSIAGYTALKLWLVRIKSWVCLFYSFGFELRSGFSQIHSHGAFYFNLRKLVLV